MQATARMASVVSSTPPARRRLIRSVRRRYALPGISLQFAQNLKTLLTILIALVLIASPGHAELFSHLTAEGGVVEYDLSKNPGNGWYSEPSSSYRFKLGFKQGERMSPNPVLVATATTTEAEHFKGKAALELQIAAREEMASRKAAYKVSLGSVSPNDPFSPSVAQAKDWYHGFALKIDAANYSLLQGAGEEVIFEQWWQGSPFHPPVALGIINETDARAQGWADANAKGNFALVLRDDEHNAWERGPGQPRYFNLGPVETGRWRQWVIRVRPDPSGKDGGVTVWMDGTEKLNLTHTAIGYDRARYPTKPTPVKTLAVDCCVYRLNGLAAQRFFFDEIKFADSFADAATP